MCYNINVFRENDMNSLLAFVDLLTRLNQINVIIGIILAVVGLSVVFLAKRITVSIRRTDDVSDDDKVHVTLKIIGLILVIAGLIVQVIM